MSSFTNDIDLFNEVLISVAQSPDGGDLRARTILLAATRALLADLEADNELNKLFSRAAYYALRNKDQKVIGITQKLLKVKEARERDK